MSKPTKPSIVVKAVGGYEEALCRQGVTLEQPRQR
jgi:hypothetical protein